MYNHWLRLLNKIKGKKDPMSNCSHKWSRDYQRTIKLANADGSTEWFGYQCTRCNIFGRGLKDAAYNKIITEQQFKKMLQGGYFNE